MKYLFSITDPKQQEELAAFIKRSEYTSAITLESDFEYLPEITINVKLSNAGLENLKYAIHRKIEGLDKKEISAFNNKKNQII